MGAPRCSGWSDATTYANAVPTRASVRLHTLEADFQPFRGRRTVARPVHAHVCVHIGQCGTAVSLRSMARSRNRPRPNGMSSATPVGTPQGADIQAPSGWQPRPNGGASSRSRLDRSDTPCRNGTHRWRHLRSCISNTVTSSTLRRRVLRITGLDHFCFGFRALEAPRESSRRRIRRWPPVRDDLPCPC